MEEGFAAFFVEVGAVGYEFVGVVPFVVVAEDVESKEFEDSDASV